MNPLVEFLLAITAARLPWAVLSIHMFAIAYLIKERPIRTFYLYSGIFTLSGVIAYTQAHVEVPDETLPIIEMAVFGFIGLLYPIFATVHIINIKQYYKRQGLLKAVAKRLSGTGAEIFEQAFMYGPMGGLVITSEGKILYLNKRLADMLGYTVPELEGTHINKIVPKLYRADHVEKIKKFMSTPSSSYAVRPVQALKKGGAEVELQLSISVLETFGISGTHTTYGIGYLGE